MAKIKEVFTNDEYYPFVSYCEEHGYEEMADLMKFPFHELRGDSDIPPRLLSKIKTIFVMYSKMHSSEFSAAKKPSVRKPVSSPTPQAELEAELEVYFQSNADRLVRISDISKSLGRKVKRSDLLKILEQAPWCKAVDATTFFYAPQS
ncbi:hypothetical protein [Caproiciproducens sp. LBM24188]|nr:hypothetical protein [Oscillospiraceae bacterium]HHV32619.1 hypothetical protein [Clostridiales bacterium]